MQIIPAIDLRAGQVVRLAQGDYARETRYSAEPLALAQSYAAAGAQWLHVVDLDGARSGTLENLRVIRAIASSSLQVQAGGGVRSEGDLQRLFDAGVARVVVGSVAVRDPERVEKAAEPGKASVDELLAADHLGMAVELLESQIKEQPENFNLWLKLAEAHGVYCRNLNVAGKIIGRIEANPRFTQEQIQLAKSKLKEWRGNNRM